MLPRIFGTLTRADKKDTLHRLDNPKHSSTSPYDSTRFHASLPTPISCTSNPNPSRPSAVHISSRPRRSHARPRSHSNMTYTKSLLFCVPLMDIVVEQVAERNKQCRLIKLQTCGREKNVRGRENTRASRKFHPYDIEKRVRFTATPMIMMMQASSQCSTAVEPTSIVEDSCFKQMLDFENSQQDDLSLPSWSASNGDANVEDTWASISGGFAVTREDFDRALPTWHSMDGSAFDQPEGDAPWIAAETARTRAEEQRVGPRFDAWALFDQDKMAAFVRDDPRAVLVFQPVPVFTAD